MPKPIYLGHPLATKAVQLLQSWLVDHQNNGPLLHAHTVASKLIEHRPNAQPPLIAAALLCQSHYVAPTTLDLETELKHLDPRTAQIVGSIHKEDQALSTFTTARHRALYVSMLLASDPAACRVSAASKVVTLSVLNLAANHETNLLGHLRTALPALRSYFRFFHTHAAIHLPATMSAELDQLPNSESL